MCPACARWLSTEYGTGGIGLHIESRRGSFVVAAGRCEHVRLDWTDTSDNEDGFAIDGTGGYFTVRPETSTANVGGLLPSTTYCFRISAFNEIGEAWSNEACATTLDPPAAR